jgi:hypothetical protein
MESKHVDYKLVLINEMNSQMKKNPKTSLLTSVAIVVTIVTINSLIFNFIGPIVFLFVMCVQTVVLSVVLTAFLCSAFYQNKLILQAKATIELIEQFEGFLKSNEEIDNKRLEIIKNLEKQTIELVKKYQENEEKSSEQY